MQSRDGFLRFIERYPHLSRQVPENIYAVPRRDSLIDFLTYRQDTPKSVNGIDDALVIGVPNRVLAAQRAMNAPMQTNRNNRNTQRNLPNLVGER